MSLELQDLLAKGYFPKELPPPFNTRSFATFVDSRRNQSLQLSKKAQTRPCIHNYSRYGMLRRKLSLPNPMNQLKIANCIVENWPSMQANFGSSISISTPTLDQLGRAVGTKLSFDSLPSVKAKVRAVSKHILTADISRYYHSIYTHSIPWAIHGKDVAKQDRSDGLWGNSLDKHIRDSQDGQTLGIPIGPDTSLIVSELIMCAVERSIGSNFQPGFRLIDDMELGFISSSAAQDYMARLQEGLSDYELALNPTKTSIRDLPCLMETSWAPPLRSFTFRTSEKGMQSDLIRYFDCAYELHQKFPNEAVISYAISRLKSEKFSCESNMKLCENLVLQSCIAQPASLRHGLHLLMEFSKSGCQMRSEELEQALNLIAQHHAPLGHGGEVAWALWGLIEFNLPLTDETVSVVSTAADSICTLLLLHANSIGLVANPSLFSILESYMTESELEHERWLVSYEADVQGWLPTFDGKDNHVKSHKFFSKLKKAGVRFYDQSARGFPLIPHSIDTFVSG